MPEGTPSKLGRYELGEVIGQGAMGVVYKAYDSFLDRIVAVKTYRQDVPFLQQARDRFEREVRTASKLSHPNIVIVYDGGLEAGVPYLAMEFIDGPTLRDELASRGRVSREEALSIVLDVCEGLAYAHGRGVVHRDLKPANVLLAPDGIAKISDFGVAKLLGTEAVTVTQTVGTPGYMAPEQIQGKPIGPTTDVFALGILAYELFTGARAFHADSAITLLFQILNTVSKPASEIDTTLPKAVDAILARAMEKDPANRTPDAATFGAELRRAFAVLPVPPPPPAEKSTTRPALFLVVLVLLAAGAGAAYWLGRSRGDAERTVVAVAERTPTALSSTPISSPAPKVEPTAIEPIAVEPTVVEAPPPPLAEAPIPQATSEPLATPIPQATAPRRAAAVQAPPTARPTAPRAPDSSIEIDSSPSNAQVRIDGELKGVTPLRVKGLGAGSVWLELRKAGYAPYEKTLRVDGSSDYTVRASLAADTRSQGFVDVSSQPAGARVRFNGAPAGSAPLKLGPLQPGRYEVTAEFPGFPKETQVIDMKVGQLHKVKFIFGSGS